MGADLALQRVDHVVQLVPRGLGPGETAVGVVDVEVERGEHGVAQAGHPGILPTYPPPGQLRAARLGPRQCAPSRRAASSVERPGHLHDLGQRDLFPRAVRQLHVTGAVLERRCAGRCGVQPQVAAVRRTPLSRNRAAPGPWQFSGVRAVAVRGRAAGPRGRRPLANSPPGPVTRGRVGAEPGVHERRQPPRQLLEGRAGERPGIVEADAQSAFGDEQVGEAARPVAGLGACRTDRAYGIGVLREQRVGVRLRWASKR